MWLIIFAYIFSIDLRHIKLRKELSRIRTILDKYDMPVKKKPIIK
ncbi:MAG: CcmD family protein [Acidobacteriia bacterium]|nr:CcmD family protein [Terriglobia bacterium]